MSKEIAVFGAGPAGLSTTRSLAESGHNVTMFKPEEVCEMRPIYTTLVNVPKWREVLDGSDIFRTVPAVRVLTESGTDFTVPSGERYVMVDYPKVLKRLEDNITPYTQIEIFPQGQLRNVHVKDLGTQVEIGVNGTVANFDGVVDCTGHQASILRKVESQRREENPVVEYVYGGIFEGYFEEEALVLTTGPVGGTCWANPSVYGEGLVDVVFSAWGWKSYFPDFLDTAPKRLDRLLVFLRDRKVIDFESLKPEEFFSGIIRSQHAPEPTTNNVYGVGESVGMAKPTAGDSFRRTLVGGELVAEAINQNESPSQYCSRWRKEWSGDNLFFLLTLARLSSQREGNLGGIADVIGKWFSSDKDTRWIERDAEKLIVGGQMSPRLLALALGNKRFRSYLLKMAVIQIRSMCGVEEEPYWTLPDLGEQEGGDSNT